MDSSTFRGLDDLFKYMFVALLVTTPLGLWKLVEIIIWAWEHVHFGAAK